MAGRIQPPPVSTPPATVNEEGEISLFDTLWLQWFIELSAQLGTDGLPTGPVAEVVLTENVFAPRPAAPYTLSDPLVVNYQSILMNQIFGP